jgi:hypothetical protein
VLNRYKEILYGVLFGLGASVIDIVMHAQMADRSFWNELLEPQPTMIFYRCLFLLFGTALGWLLWKRNRREREFRRLAEIYQRFHREVAEPAFLIHGKCQELLFLGDNELPAQARESVRFVYDKARSIESLAKEHLAITATTS